MEFLRLVGATVLSVVALFIITKIMGHKQVSQLDFFDYVSGITIGSIGAELATDLETPWKSLSALVIYGVVSVLLNVIAHKLPKTRKYLNGSPTILLDNGKLYRENLRKAKLDLSELLLLCREQGYFDLDEIQTAIFEPNGRLSVLPKSENRPLTPADLNRKVEENCIGIELIMDGRILGENLLRMQKDEQWLRQQLSRQGYRNAKEILLGIYHSDKRLLRIYPKE